MRVLIGFAITLILKPPGTNPISSLRISRSASYENRYRRSRSNRLVRVFHDRGLKPGGGTNIYDPLELALLDPAVDLLAEHVARCGGELVRICPQLATRIVTAPGPTVSDDATDQGAAVYSLMMARPFNRTFTLAERSSSSVTPGKERQPSS